jgi:hypothetical protein
VLDDVEVVRSTLHKLPILLACRDKDQMRRALLMALVPLVIQAGMAPARAEDSGAATVGLCPNINFTGFSVGSDKVHVAERMWWDAQQRSYFVQGPGLALRFLYPDGKRPLAGMKSDPAYVYQIPIDKTLTLVDQDSCRPKVEISSQCQLAAVPGASSEPALIFTAEYYDECNQKPVQVVIRVEKLSVGARTGIQFSFYNSFRNIYDSGMDVFEGENVFNMGYRLK